MEESVFGPYPLPPLYISKGKGQIIVGVRDFSRLLFWANHPAAFLLRDPSSNISPTVCPSTVCIRQETSAISLLNQAKSFPGSTLLRPPPHPSSSLSDMTSPLSTDQLKNSSAFFRATWPVSPLKGIGTGWNARIMQFSIHQDALPYNSRGRAARRVLLSNQLIPRRALCHDRSIHSSEITPDG